MEDLIQRILASLSSVDPLSPVDVRPLNRSQVLTLPNAGVKRYYYTYITVPGNQVRDFDAPAPASLILSSHMLNPSEITLLGWRVARVSGLMLPWAYVFVVEVGFVSIEEFLLCAGKN
jgi:hypothetical protein